MSFLESATLRSPSRFLPELSFPTSTRRLSNQDSSLQCPQFHRQLQALHSPSLLQQASEVASQQEPLHTTAMGLGDLLHRKGLLLIIEVERVGRQGLESSLASFQISLHPALGHRQRVAQVPSMEQRARRPQAHISLADHRTIFPTARDTWLPVPTGYWNSLLFISDNRSSFPSCDRSSPNLFQLWGLPSLPVRRNSLSICCSYYLRRYTHSWSLILLVAQYTRK